MMNKWIVTALLLGVLAVAVTGCMPYGSFGSAGKSCGCGKGVEATPASVAKDAKDNMDAKKE